MKSICHRAGAFPGATGADHNRQKPEERKTMTIQILNTPGELYLGSNPETAMAQGARRFSTAAKAVRFAMEHAAPVSLNGASLQIEDMTFGPRQIKSLHRQMALLGQAQMHP
jgi:hypothetical protein